MISSHEAAHLNDSVPDDFAVAVSTDDAPVPILPERIDFPPASTDFVSSTNHSAAPDVSNANDDAPGPSTDSSMSRDHNALSMMFVALTS